MTYPEHSVEQDQQNFEKPQSGHGGQRFAHFAKFFLFSFLSFVSFCFTGFHRTSFNFTKLHFLLTQKGINFLTCKVIVLGGFLSNHFIQEALKFCKKKKEAVNNNSKFPHALHWAFTFCNISYFLDGSTLNSRCRVSLNFLICYSILDEIWNQRFKKECKVW